MISSLKKLEQRLAREAAAFGNRKTDQKAFSGHTVWKICGLTGLPPTEKGFHAKAVDRLRRMLAAQRRWARTAHPAYDLNRHISIREALEALESAGAIQVESNKGRMPSRISGPKNA